MVHIQRSHSKFSLLRNKRNKSFEKSEDEDVDKGYFGILNYFIQAISVLRLTLELEARQSVLSTMLKIEKYISLSVSIELSHLSSTVCPHTDITTLEKFNLKFIFLTMIYFFWIVLFATCMLLLTLTSKECNINCLTFVKLRSIKGITEIIKYTYGGFTGVIFMFLTCVTIAEDVVWKYDGTVYCLNTSQIGMLIICLLYVVPFPLMLIMGLNLLKKGIISSTNFLRGCILPLPFLIFWLTMLKARSKKITTTNKMYGNSENSDSIITTSAQEILNSFQGSYKVTKNGTQYWESVMILRRLLLGATSLFHNSIVQMICCCFLCIIFLLHHVISQPFLSDASNYIESFSLFFLCIVSIISLLKSFYIQMGIVPQGQNVNYFLCCGSR